VARVVSVVIPARDEARHIEACVRSVREQEVAAELVVIVADGGSEDGTAALAERAGATVIANAKRSVPAGLNAGLAAARGDVLVRFDAHAVMPPGYIAACLRALDEEPGAGNVGGWRRAVGRDPWGRALAAALASPLGVGNARIWRRPSPGTRRIDVDTVPLGCFPTELLRAVGGWREDLLANEDFDLNHRLRLRGCRVVFDPDIWSIYHPREDYAAIVRQYWRYGTWKAKVLLDAPESLRPRQLAPLGVLALAAAAPFSRGARRGLGAYGAALAIAGAVSPGGWRTAPVLATMHLVWGSGLVTEAARALRSPT
jgi:glycosyltransferase involved in cell wall biosynthesis